MACRHAAETVKRPDNATDGVFQRLVSHSQPMIEILNPYWGDLHPVFEREFQGMVVEPVTARGTEDCRGTTGIQTSRGNDPGGKTVYRIC